MFVQHKESPLPFLSEETHEISEKVGGFMSHTQTDLLLITNNLFFFRRTKTVHFSFKKGAVGEMNE